MEFPELPERDKKAIIKVAAVRYVRGYPSGRTREEFELELIEDELDIPTAIGEPEAFLMHYDTIINLLANRLEVAIANELHNEPVLEFRYPNKALLIRIKQELTEMPKTGPTAWMEGAEEAITKLLPFIHDDDPDAPETELIECETCGDEVLESTVDEDGLCESCAKRIPKQQRG
jgi:hypothetical protein